MAKKKSLGKGLGALIPQDLQYKEESDDNRIEYVDISKIEKRDDQPRKEFDPDALKDLSDSIRQYGVIQPIILAKNSDGGYRIIAGERRYRASLLAGKDKIPAIIKELDDLEVEILSLIENVQREDLNPYEEAMAYTRFADEFNMTQKEISEKIGKSRSYIANSQRLLKLDDKTIEDLKEGKLTNTQARTLLSIEDLDERDKYRGLLIKKEINIKELEDIFKKRRVENRSKRKSRDTNKDIYIQEMEERFRELLGTKVTINKKRGVWNASIELYSEEDVENLLNRLEESK